MRGQEWIWGIIALDCFLLMTYGTAYLGNLAWRHPDKLTQTAINRSVRYYGSNAFVWSVRFLTVVWALGLLMLLLISVVGVWGLFEIHFGNTP